MTDTTCRTVHKYPIRIADRVTISMPEQAKVMHVARQHGTLCVWVLVHPDAPTEPRTFAVIGTGHPVPPSATYYIGTVIDAGGALVWHVFEVQESEGAR